MKAFARNLRQNQTLSEQKLWLRLRNHQIEGFGFRRQQPIGPYVVDFCCFERKLVLEIDGGVHNDQVDYDQKRQTHLEKQGFRVLRFTVDDVVSNLEGVVEAVAMVLRESHRATPHSPPSRGQALTLPCLFI